MEPPEVARDYKPIHPGTDWREAFKRLLGPIAVAIGAIAKYGFAFAKFASIFVAIGGYALINLRAGFLFSNGWEAFVWAKNVFDQHYFQYLSAQPGNSGAVFGLLGDPRTVGVTVRWRN